MNTPRALLDTPSGWPVRDAAALPSSLVCAGCGYAAPVAALPLSCPIARPGDDIDHVLRRALDIEQLDWPAGDEPNPFVRYRTLWHAYHIGRAAGRSDVEIVAQIEQLDEAVAAVDGHGFSATPLAVADFGGPTLIKDETGNVSGSHKARHLFGTLLALRLSGHDDPGRPLAIASCGNAALAAAVVARAAGRELLVFVPVDAEGAVVDRLADLGATVTVCQRRPTEKGDPTVLRLRAAIADGAIPFTCQGNENGLAIEGGLTLGYELVDQARAIGRTVDHLFVQVGGGALAASAIQALDEARALGALDELPRIYAVQTENAHPLARAFERIAARIGPDATAESVLARAASQRSSFMWPWESVPHSIASGILDDETYDWLAVVRGLLATGGRVVLVDEDELRQANELARATTGIDVDPTGSAGLAGLLQLRRSGEIPSTPTAAVLFTGIRRSAQAPRTREGR